MIICVTCNKQCAVIVSIMQIQCKYLFPECNKVVQHANRNWNPHFTHGDKILPPTHQKGKEKILSPHLREQGQNKRLAHITL